MKSLAEFLRDPVLQGAGAGFFALIFAGAAWHKLRVPAVFRTTLAAYRLVPSNLVSATAASLAAAEPAIAFMLLWTPARTAGFLLAAALLALYAGAIGVNLARGRDDIDCGCGGEAQPLSWALIVRNALLAGLALIWAAPPADRALGPIDLACLAVVTLGGFGFYHIVEGVLRHRRLLATLPREPELAQRETP
jgi:hypothetical protein